MSEIIQTKDVKESFEITNNPDDTPELQEYRQQLEEEHQRENFPLISCKECNDILFVYTKSKTNIIYECKKCKAIQETDLDSFTDNQNEMYIKKEKYCYNTEEHEQEEIAEKYCTICDKNMCGTCLGYHDKLFKDHKLIDCYSNTYQKCLVHNELLDRYCLNCHMELCKGCEKDHNEHYNSIINVENLISNEKIIDIFKQFNEAKNAMSGNEEIKDRLIEDINKEISSIKKNYSNLVNKINEESDNKIKDYQNNIRELKIKISEEKKTRKKKILKEFKNQKDLINELEMRSRHIKDLYLQNQNDNQLLIKFTNIILYNYLEQRNKYYNVQNVLHNCKFNLKSFEYPDNTPTAEPDENNSNKEKKEETLNINNKLIQKFNEVENYFNNYYILLYDYVNQKQVDELNLEEIKIDEDNYDGYSLLNKITDDFNESFYCNTQHIIFCPKCYMIPLCIIINKKELYFSCKNCKTEAVLNIKDMVECLEKNRPLLKNDKVPLCEISGTNETHGKRPSSVHCLNCNKFYCNECIKSHINNNKNHLLINNLLNIDIKCNNQKGCSIQRFYNKINKKFYCDKCLSKTEEMQKKNMIISFDEIIDDEMIKKVKSNIIKAENKINVTNLKTKDSIIENIKNEKNEIERQYKEIVKEISQGQNKKIEELNKKIEEINKLIEQEQQNTKSILQDAKDQRDAQIEFIDNEVNDIEAKYTDNKSFNTEILNLFKVFISNYEYYGKNIYNSICNIIVNSQFNLSNYNDYIKQIYNYEKLNEGGLFLSYLTNDIIVNLGKIQSHKDLLIPTTVNLDLLVKKYEISKHINEVYHILQLPDGRLASCSDDNSILIYNKNSFEVEIKIANNKEIKNDQFIKYINLLSNNKLISCSCNHMKIWEIYEKKYKLVHTLTNAHEKDIIKVIPITKNRFASCSCDSSIKIWDSKTYNLLNIMNGYSNWVISIYQLSNEILVSGSWKELSLKFWDVDSYQLMFDINNIETGGPNNIFETYDHKLLVGGKCKIAVININLNYNVEQIIKIKGYGAILCFAYMKDGTIICGNGEGEIIKLDNGYKVCQKIKAHKHAIPSMLVSNENYIVTCGLDKLIKIFEYLE